MFSLCFRAIADGMRGTIVIAGHAGETAALPLGHISILLAGVSAGERNIAHRARLHTLPATDASVGICPERFVACGIADKKRIYHIRFEAGHTAAMGEIALLAGDNAVCDTPNGSRSLGQLPVAHSRRIYIEAREQHIRIGHNEREGSIGRYTRFLHHAIPQFGQIADIVAASAQHIGIIFTRYITFYAHVGENFRQIFRHTP